MKYLLCLFLCIFTYSSLVALPKAITPHSSKLKKDLSPLDTKKMLEAYIQKYPELLWLADADVLHTEEAHSQRGSFASEIIFGQKFIEFDRTISTLYSLKLILDGSAESYELFTAAQPKDSRLKWESFQKLHHFNKIAGIARQDPKLLQNEFYIDSEGTVLLR